ncbi:flagellar biosynthetic protein FliR [Candidatus Liberibacter sp.]|uniref:flagellar biosynthetic protein FliR n=1 Tax=Candidatus Liberibacter sp. TaxID=34022 RepID=UPI0015F5B88C|nr:flagellar biosynthetic protein FliR [Candidatus Liberibacter sp.]MBA5723541.1 flagellar type III secretion system protein FliR [Candidatus Liberibacter sp.]
MIDNPYVAMMSLFLVFCRVGSCVMILPGFSTTYVTMQVRLYIAITISIVLLPFLWDMVYPQAADSRLGASYLKLIAIELLLGFMYGFLARGYTLGLQFLGGVISNAIGLNVQPGAGILESNPETSITSFISVIGFLALLAMDFHHQIFHALVKSYTVTPLGGKVNLGASLASLVDTLRLTFSIMLRLSSPFLLFCVTFNIAIGFLNKLVPQIPIYFISTPYMVGLGCFFLYLSIEIMIYQLSHSFRNMF